MTNRTKNQPTQEMFPALRELWRICFDDPESIVDLIFQQITRAENTRVLTDKQGNPLSMLFIQPTRLHLAGEQTPAASFDCAYIYGVATHPNQRGLGLSSRLLEETVRELGSRVRALTLVPSGPELVGYYARQGFSKAFSHRVIHITPAILAEIVTATGSDQINLTPRRLADLSDLRDQSLMDSPLALLWDRDYLGAINEECRLYHGETLHFETPGAEGYLVYYQDDGQNVGRILIKEYVELLRPGGLSPLPGVLATLHRRLEARRYTLRLRSDHPSLFEGELTLFGMIRMLDGSSGGFDGRALGYLAHAMD